MSKWDTNIRPFMKEIEDWARRGASEKEIAGNLNVGYSTFRKYAREQEELSAALKRGRRHARRIMQQALQKQSPRVNVPTPLQHTAPFEIPPGSSLSRRPDQQGRHRGPFERNKKKIYATQEVCGICGKPVNKKLKYPHPLSPCIDHIIPIAKGGHPSDLSNLQLAHWTCNRQKSDKLFSGGSQAKVIEVISNRVLPQSMDWTAYRAKG